MEVSNRILSDITVYMKYAKYLPQEHRRETWEELTNRNKNMHIKKYPHLKDEIEYAYTFVLDKKVLPSMRSMQFAGKPIEINNSRIYNCAYLPIEHISAFSEVMFLLLGGTGVGYSVQRHHIEKLPEIIKPNPNKVRKYLVGDSIEGWADLIKMIFKSYFGKSSYTIKPDYSDIRPKGSRLITSGGKAPGHEPLMFCVNNIVNILNKKENGEKLSDVEVHDIICHIADAVLAGGIRRAALICLFNSDSHGMLTAKSNFKVFKWDYVWIEHIDPISGEKTSIQSVNIDKNTGNKYFDLEVEYEDPYYGNKKTKVYWVSENDISMLMNDGVLPWYYFQGQRGRANNSAVLLRHKITKDYFMNLWKKTEESKAGEPGIFFTNDKDWGTNPCGEIALRPYQFCNLVEINASNIVSQEDLNQRAKVATFIATLQAGYTDFHYLRDIWKKTTEKDALIGVGMTGIVDGIVLNLNLKEAAEVVLKENERVAALIGINKSARTTTVKPSGTTSLVLGTASGIHARHAKYYIRRIRVNKNEAIYDYLIKNHPSLVEDDVTNPKKTAVISIPQKSPENSILRTESPLDTLERVKKVTTEWVRTGHRNGQNTHNVSCTISLKDDEWDSVGEWMWNNRDYYTGISVLPFDGGTYKQAPFEEITEEKYNEMIKSLMDVNLSLIFESDDETNLMGELACAGNACEIK